MKCQCGSTNVMTIATQERDEYFGQATCADCGAEVCASADTASKVLDILEVAIGGQP